MFINIGDLLISSYNYACTYSYILIIIILILFYEYNYCRWQTTMLSSQLYTYSYHIYITMHEMSGYLYLICGLCACIQSFCHITVSLYNQLSLLLSVAMYHQSIANCMTTLHEVETSMITNDTDLVWVSLMSPMEYGLE